MAQAAIAAIGKLLAEKGLEMLNQQLAEYGELKPGQAREALVKFVEESDVRERYGLIKSYSESIEDLFHKLRTEDWYVWMSESTLKGTIAHDNWKYLSGRYLFNQAWHHERYDGHPEGRMFLRAHLHILLDAVGFSDLRYRETVIEKHWGDLLSISEDCEYGKIWNACYGFGPPEEPQFFSHAGTLYSARSNKYLATVFKMYNDMVSLLKQQGKIKRLVSYKDEYYIVTIFAPGNGKQNIY